MEERLFICIVMAWATVMVCVISIIVSTGAKIIAESLYNLKISIDNMVWKHRRKGG